MRNGIGSLTTGETVAGWIWLPIYLFLLPLAVQLCDRAFSWGLTGFSANLICFGVNFIAVLAIFSRYLLRTLPGRGLFRGLLAIALGAAVLYGGSWLTELAAQRLRLSLPQYNNDAVVSMIGQDRTLMLIVCVVIAPVIEETLLRGLVYGSAKRISGAFAFLLSVLIFVFMHVWGYFGLYPTPSVLLCALTYLPAAVGFCLTAAVSDTVWSSILLHAFVNAVSFGVIKFF